MACGANYVHGWRWPREYSLLTLSLVFITYILTLHIASITDFSGNFWMTRCSHVSKLNAPFFPEVLQEKNTPHSYPPYGRYMAEYWMMNDAGDRPEHSDNNAPYLIPPTQVCPHASNAIELESSKVGGNIIIVQYRESLADHLSMS